MDIFSIIGIRFREQHLHPEKPEVLIERFKSISDENIPDLSMQLANHSVFIKVSPGMHKWWSPELTLNIEGHLDGSSITHVTGPNPGTFTFAMFVISSAIVIFFFDLMFALSQIQLNTSPLISMLVIAGSIALTLLVIAILGWGRKKAHEQMGMMSEFVRTVLNHDQG